MRTVVELHQEVFVLRAAVLQERDGSFMRRRQDRLHATARIENDSNADRRVFGGEVLDILLDSVFVDFEVILL